MGKSILVISYVPSYNRQGYDFAACLRDAGYNVRLYQMNGVDDRQREVYGVRCVKPTGVFHKLKMLRNLLAFLVRTLFVGKSIVVCVGKPMLVLGGLYHVLFGSKLIWYSLEYSRLGLMDRWVYQSCVSGYVDVEEHRREAIFTQYGKKDASLVCYNMPHLLHDAIAGGRLRAFLRDKHGMTGKEKLVVYAGSYQKYACLENIVCASVSFPESWKLILMTYGLPGELGVGSKNCIVVPPVGGEEFYNWLADADCALLPYEDKEDFNVLNCSPQKIFDCYCVGVPYVASDRPIVKKVLACCPGAGAVCDFTCVNSIREAVIRVGEVKRRIGCKMQELHANRFNYDIMKSSFRDLIERVYA